MKNPMPQEETEKTESSFSASSPIPGSNLTAAPGGDLLALRSAVGSGPQILDGDDVQCVEGHDFTIAVHHSKGARSDQDHFWMADGILATVRGAQRKRLKPAFRHEVPNSFQIHAASLLPLRFPVKRTEHSSLISDQSITGHFLTKFARR